MALYTIAAGGTDAQRVRTITDWRHPLDDDRDPTQSWFYVDWSPDGSKILYSCGGTCVVDLDDLPLREAPPSAERVAGWGAAAWSPDGSRIALVEFEGPDPYSRQHPIVSTMAPDGSDVRVLTRLGPESQSR